MLQTRTHVAALAFGASLVLAASACDDHQPSAAPRGVTASATGSAATDPQVKQKADELLGQLTAGAFPRQLLIKPNGTAFVYIARHSNEPDAARAALEAMAYVFTSYSKAKDKVLAESAYHETVLARLDDPIPKVQYAAMIAAANSITGKSPNEAVVAKIVALARNHPRPEGRYAAIDQIWKMSRIDQHDEELEPLVEALEAAQAWLVSRALFRLKGKLSSYAKKELVKTKLIGLLKHADPGVRGRAADALASLATPDPQDRAKLAELVAPLLHDESPFARSAACSAVAWLRYKPALHEIILLVDDDSDNTYDIRGFQELDGSPGSVHHEGSAWSRVSDAALYAIKVLTDEDPDEFSYKIDAHHVDEDLKKAAADAHAWYAKAKGRIPKGAKPPKER